MEEKLLKLSQVSAQLSASRATIYRLMERGELVPVRLGRVLRFPASGVAKLIEDMKAKAAHAEAA